MARCWTLQYHADHAAAADDDGDRDDDDDDDHDDGDDEDGEQVCQISGAAAAAESKSCLTPPTGTIQIAGYKVSFCSIFFNFFQLFVKKKFNFFFNSSNWHNSDCWL